MGAFDAATPGGIDWEDGPARAHARDAREPDRGDLPEEVSAWWPVVLTGFLDGSYRPPVPTLLPRTDGVCLLYRGLTHSLHGESESGKSLVVQLEAVRILAEGGRVLYLDFESDAASVVGRMLEFGANPATLADRLVYVAPETSPEATHVDRNAWLALLAHKYDLAVLDGVTAALGLFRAETASNDDLTSWARTFPDRIAKATGAAVVLVDHVAKNTETRGRFAIGGQAKLAVLTGAAYTVEVAHPLGRGMRGVVVLRVGKDRPGQVRAHAGAWRHTDRTQEAARVVVDSTGVPSVVTVEPPHDGSGDTDSFRPTALMEKLSRAMEEAGEPLSFRQLDGLVKGRAQYKRDALGALVAEGYAVAPNGAHGSRQHSSVKPYRQTDDPLSDAYNPGTQSADSEESLGQCDRVPPKGVGHGTQSFTASGTQSGHGRDTVAKGVR